MSATRANDYRYDAVFHRFAERMALRSAQVIVPVVVEALGSRSVLDVGCGTGTWLREYTRHGLADVMGLDSEDLNPRALLIPRDRFKAVDISQPFDLGRRFDLVQCLETAEHLSPDASRTIVANLTTHGRLVLFSAAVPGQGGENHVNEQPYEFWRALLAERGFVAFDFVRPAVRDLPQVEPWYRYNTLLYVHEDACQDLPCHVQSTRVPEPTAIRDISPLAYRVRKAVLRHVPRPVVSRLAILKHRLMPIRRVSSTSPDATP